MRGGGKVKNTGGRKPVVTGIEFCFEIKKSFKKMKWMVTRSLSQA